MNFVYAYMDNVLLPPEEGGQEPESGEWLKIPAIVNQNHYTLPHSEILLMSRAVLSDAGDVLRFEGMPDHYLTKKVSEKTMALVIGLSWDTQVTRCEDCPEWPWKTLMDREVIAMRQEDLSGSVENWYRDNKGPNSVPEKDLQTIIDSILSDYLYKK